LQKITKARTPHNGQMCKDKWNALNFDFEKISNFYYVIESFQGEREMNIHLHVKDVKAKGDGVYIPPQRQDA